MKAKRPVTTRAVSNPAGTGFRRPHRASRPSAHGARPDRLVVQEPAQVVGQLSGRGVPLAGLLLQALQADRLKSRGVPGWSSRGGTGARRTTCSRVVTQSVPRNGGRPVNISYRITPSA